VKGREIGVALTVKVRLTWVWTAPETALRVTCACPVAAFAAVTKFNVPALPELTTSGMGKTVTPEGMPVAVTVTGPEKLFSPVTETLSFWLEPDVTKI
jgi:hypothetical protein